MVTTACSWAATTTASWLTTTDSGTGNGTVQYSVAANTTGASRTGTISVGLQNFTVTQAASCTYTLTPFSYQADPAGATSTFTVAPSSTGCPWTATASDATIVTVTSGASGTGNGTVGFKVAANTTQSARAAAIAVGNTAFTIYQPGGPPCSYALSAGSASFPSSGGSNSFTVVSTCTWTPTTPVDWIQLGSTAAVTGNGTVVFFVAPNPTGSTRSSFITVGNQSFQITETGVTCNVTVAQSSVVAPASGVQGALSVTAPDGCSWTPVSGASWITLQSGAGLGQGAVMYTVAPNTTAAKRASTITISNQVIAVAQDAADCSGQVLTPGHVDLSAMAGTYRFNVGTACSYTAIANDGWIKIVSGASGTGSADIGYSVSANSSADPRIGTISVGAQTFTVSQSGTSCTLSLSPTSASVAGQGGSGSFNVTASASCRWQPVSDVGWIHFTYASANGSGRVSYTADLSGQAQPRLGNIFINGQDFQLTQGGRPAVQVTSAGVVNGGSLANGPVAPGEIVTIFGDGLGPDAGAGLQLTPDQQALTTSLAGVSVLFDGNPAPMIYASRTQISVIVPYSVDQQTSTQMQVDYQGYRSSAVTLNVAASAPGLFTLDSSGAGQGAILNQNARVNSAANPAAKNSVVVLFATGEGQTIPAGTDGMLARAPLPKPLLPVSVQIGGRDATVLYAGAAPGLPAGVLQVNVRVPAQTATGAQPVVLTIGSAQSQAGVTVAVQ